MMQEGPEEEGETCSICLEPLIEEKQLVTLSACHHQFHRACISQLHSLVCPLCRARINLADFEDSRLIMEREVRDEREQQQHRIQFFRQINRETMGIGSATFIRLVVDIFSIYGADGLAGLTSQEIHNHVYHECGSGRDAGFPEGIVRMAIERFYHLFIQFPRATLYVPHSPAAMHCLMLITFCLPIPIMLSQMIHDFPGIHMEELKEIIREAERFDLMQKLMYFCLISPAFQRRLGRGA